MGGDPRLRCPRLRGIPQKKVRQKSFTPKNLPPSGGFFVPRAPKKGAFFFAPAFALRGCIAHCTVRHALRGSPPYPFRIAGLCRAARHALRGRNIYCAVRRLFHIAGLSPPAAVRRTFRSARLSRPHCLAFHIAELFLVARCFMHCGVAAFCAAAPLNFQKIRRQVVGAWHVFVFAQNPVFYLAQTFCRRKKLREKPLFQR